MALEVRDNEVRGDRLNRRALAHNIGINNRACCPGNGDGVVTRAYNNDVPINMG